MIYLIADAFDEHGEETGDLKLGPFTKIVFEETDGTNNALYGVRPSGYRFLIGCEHRGGWTGGLLEETRSDITYNFEIISE